jgi:hypothetical protein
MRTTRCRVAGSLVGSNMAAGLHTILLGRWRARALRNLGRFIRR